MYDEIGDVKHTAAPRPGVWVFPFLGKVLFFRCADQGSPFNREVESDSTSHVFDPQQWEP